MDPIVSQTEPASPVAANARQMVPAVLMGSHSHATVCGINVHVYLRGGKYIGRGRYEGQMFGETLGDGEAAATVRLRQLLVEIDNKSFVRPSEARKRPLATATIPRLTVRQLANEFLAEKRKVKGWRTAGTYRSRLRPVLDFAEQPFSRKRWPMAVDLDRDFAIELRSYLHQRESTRNGRPGAPCKLMSGSQIVNVLTCLRTMLAWARNAEVRKLPPDWPIPLTPELVGSPPTKDPLRQDKLPLEDRIRLVKRMDRWQLCHLTLSVILPLRPEEATGLLVSDVNFDAGWLQIGTRLEGADYTKGRTSFVLPFPRAIRPILIACIGGRAEGPLLRTRKHFDSTKGRQVTSLAELTDLYKQKMILEPRDTVLCEQDRKEVFRRLLRALGGVSPDQLAKECKALFEAAMIVTDATLYTLRGSVTTSMERAKLPHLELRYLTSHTTDDILNHYVGLDPVGAMQMYFDAIAPLLEAIARRCQTMGIMAS